MTGDFKEIVFSEDAIKKRVAELGARISLDYAGKRPLLLGILKGCFMFLADLARRVEFECEVRFLAAASYGASSISSGNVKLGPDMDFGIEGRDVIIVEDIIDSGITLSTLKEFMNTKSPETLKICALLDKPARRKVPIDADYLGFTCPDEFLVGYGLDYAERYRNLPYIAALKPEVYSQKNEVIAR